MLHLSKTSLAELLNGHMTDSLGSAVGNKKVSQQKVLQRLRCALVYTGQKARRDF